MKKFIARMAAAVILAAVLSGCTSAPKEPVTSIIISGIHDKAPAINYTAYEKPVSNAVESGGSVIQIIDDGSASVTVDMSIPDKVEGVKINDLPGEQREEAFEAFETAIMNELTSYKAKSEEVDLLKSLDKAGKLARKNRDGRTVLYVFDSGLSTEGYFNLTSEGFTLDQLTTDKLIESLKEAKAIPDLSEIDYVEWYYLGCVSGTQMEPSEADKELLEEMITAVIEEGGSMVEFMPDQPGEGETAGLPAVKEVPVGARTLIPPHKFDESVLKFAANSDQFDDEAKAYEVLGEAADTIKEHPNSKVVIGATTASGDKKKCDELSRIRAERVASVLKECGVKEEQIAGVYGLGADNHWHKDGDLVNGTYIEDIAMQNRLCIILDEKDEDAQYMHN